jgi:hypothetical protein
VSRYQISIELLSVSTCCCNFQVIQQLSSFQTPVKMFLHLQSTKSAEADPADTLFCQTVTHMASAILQ